MVQTRSGRGQNIANLANKTDDGQNDEQLASHPADDDEEEESNSQQQVKAVAKSSPRKRKKTVSSSEVIGSPGKGRKAAALPKKKGPRKKESTPPRQTDVKSPKKRTSSSKKSHLENKKADSNHVEAHIGDSKVAIAAVEDKTSTNDVNGDKESFFSVPVSKSQTKQSPSGSKGIQGKEENETYHNQDKDEPSAKADTKQTRSSKKSQKTSKKDPMDVEAFDSKSATEGTEEKTNADDDHSEGESFSMPISNSQKKELPKESNAKEGAESAEESDHDQDKDESIQKANAKQQESSPDAFHLLSVQKHHKPPVSIAASKTKMKKNELSKLIPGYTAPMKLDTSSLLKKYQPKGGISELCKRAQETDKSTASFVVKSNSTTTKKQVTPSLYASSFKNGGRNNKKDKPVTPGDGWFGFVPTEMTDEVKQDLALIRNRTYLDPKRFYKKADLKKKNNNNFVQVGTVVEGAAEFYSSRLTRKQQKATLIQEVMADPDTATYATKKYKRMQQERSDSGRKRAKFSSKKKHFGKGRKGY